MSESGRSESLKMKNPRRFPVSLGVSQSIMLFMYLFTSLMAYTYGGQNVEGFILYSLPQNGLRTACSLLVGIHIIVAYMVTNQPLSYKAHEFFSRATLHASSVKASLIHFGITVVFLATGFVVANLIPFFASMQGVIAAFAASPIVFFYPAYFYFKASKRAGHWGGVPVLEKMWLGTMVFVIFPFCFFVGLASSISDIASGWSGESKVPFACIQASQL